MGRAQVSRQPPDFGPSVSNLWGPELFPSVSLMVLPSLFPILCYFLLSSSFLLAYVLFLLFFLSIFLTVSQFKKIYPS